MTAPELPDNELALLQRRLEREREARKQAEQLLNDKAGELLAINQALQTALADMADVQLRLRLALWGSGELMWEWDATSNDIHLHRFEAPDGQETVEVIPFPTVSERIHPDDFPSAMLVWNSHLLGNTEVYDVEYRIKGETGWRWIRTRGRAIERNSAGVATRISGTRKDISGQRAAEENQRLLAAAFANTRDAIMVLAADQRILQVNAACAKLLGHPLEQLIGHTVDKQLLDSSGHFPWSTFLGQHSWQGELTCIQAGGSRLPLDVTASAIRDADGKLTQLVLSLRDISERQRAAENVERLTRYDHLTQLPNRQQFQQQLEQRLKSLASGEQLAVLFLDLDGFKEINDALGHQAGDALLMQVADRLQHSLRKRDVIARWGGDEFAILISTSDTEYLDVAKKLVTVMNDPFPFGEEMITTTISIGITLAPLHSNEAGLLLRQADAAMYAAKRDGRNRYTLYRPDMNENLLHRVKLSNLMRRAVDNGEFTLALQPKVAIPSRKIAGAEALLRWEPEELGRIPPATFIPLAEELGLIVPIGHWLMLEATGLLAQWQRDRHDIKLAINLSGRQLRDENLAAVLHEAVRLSNAPVDKLELEVTESFLLEDITFASERLQRLRDSGFSIALDDFGTGYSSLSYLKLLPLDRVKIDRSFISDLDMSPRGRALLSSIVTLCRALQLQITAEGVETQAQLDLVEADGIDEVQGYFFYRPMSISEFHRLLRQESPTSSAP